MIVEVFKSFEDGLLLFNAVYPDTGWRFDSYNQRDGETTPPYRESGWISAAAPAAKDRPDTIYFDSKPGRYKLKSTVKNVVIDMKPPELVSWTGNFTVFEGEKWSAEFVIRDDSGIDSGVYEITAKTPDNIKHVLALSTRKESDPPAYIPQVTVDGSDNGISFTLEHSENDPTLYRIKLEIDPSKLGEWEKAGDEGSLIQCNEYIKYARFSLIVYDIAGNQIDLIDPKTFPKTFAVYSIDKESILGEVSRLTLDFVNTYPPGLLVGPDMIGKTTILVTNRNLNLVDLGFHVVFGLKPDSVGYLSGLPSNLSLSQDGTYYSHTHDVDGIDSTGYVQAFAYLDGTLGNISCEISGETISVEIDDDLSQDVRGMTYVEGILGKFISECLDNKRKLYVDPFIPDILKGEGIFGLCKVFENYLNTIYTPMEGDCRIGILEKIHRISEFKDPRECEPRLLTRFADEHGSELKFNREDVEKVASVLRKYTVVDNKTISQKDLVDKIYRRYYEILPYINMYKGTEKSFDLIYSVLGLRVELFPLWEGPDHKMVREDKAGDDYWLTSHLEVEVHGEYSDDDMRVLSDFSLEAAKSILPVIRVIDTSTIVDDFVDDNDLRLTVIDFSSDDVKLKPEIAIFSWENKKIPKAKNRKNDLEIYLPMDSQAIFYKDYVATKKADTNPAFWFSRWGAMRNTYGSIPLQFAFGEVMSIDGSLGITEPSSYLSVYPYSIEIRQDRVVLHLDDNEQNRQYLNSWNIWSNTDNSTLIAFKIFRSKDYTVTLENHCESIDFDSIPRVRQGWTESNIPSGNKLRHDFDDGRGLVSAAPYDNSSIENNLTKLVKFPVNLGSSSVSNSLEKIVEYKIGFGSSSVSNEIISIEEQ